MQSDRGGQVPIPRWPRRPTTRRTASVAAAVEQGPAGLPAGVVRAADARPASLSRRLTSLPSATQTRCASARPAAARPTLRSGWPCAPGRAGTAWNSPPPPYGHPPRRGPPRRALQAELPIARVELLVVEFGCIPSEPEVANLFFHRRAVRPNRSGTAVRALSPSPRQRHSAAAKVSARSPSPQSRLIPRTRRTSLSRCWPSSPRRRTAASEQRCAPGPPRTRTRRRCAPYADPAPP